MLTFGSLFSGIGGIDLGFERAGLECMFQVEIDPYCNKVLEKHWPGVARWGDIKTLNKDIVDGLVNLTYNSSKALEELDMPKGLDPKYDKAISLYNSGLSIQDVADYFDITRQAMHLILRRRNVEFRPQLKKGEDNYFYRGGASSDRRCHGITERAIKKGILIPEPCELCDASGIMDDGRNIVQAHHDNYNEPLKVRWLCQKCHHEWHKENKAISREEGIREPARRMETVDVLVGGFP